MSIFSKIRGAKKAADEHKDAKAQNTVPEKTDKPVPYRHVPTHAAIDAISGAPSSWKAQDKSAIKAQHKRRSAMSRNSSNLSTVTMMQNTSNYQGSEWTSSRLETRKSHHGYQGYQNYQPESGIGRSPLASSEISPINSSGNSTASNSSSSQVLELPSRQHAVRHPENNIFEHIHKSTTRKVGEAPLYDVAPPRPKNDAPVTIIPIQPKRKAWAFGKKSNAIAAH
ncbi:MAG: hypothetical protein M1830_003327 [Pleopsidium flavum]|nr:MAG: hypothetical protein M1830_003327 [Pleopsidium flavum]